MRTVMTALLWLVTTAALTVAIGAGWTAMNVQSQSGFVDLNAELSTDPEVQAQAADLAGRAFADQSGLPSVASDQVSNLITTTVQRLTSADGWPETWARTMEQTHQDLFDGPVPDTVVVDFAPIVALALQEATADLPISLPAPQSLPVTVGAADPSTFVRAVSASTTVAVVAAGVAAIAALLALATSRRRSTTLAALGAGVLVAAALWRWGAPAVAPDLIDRAQTGPTDSSALLSVLADRGIDSLSDSLLWVAVAGGALLVVGLVTRVVRR